MQRASDAWRKSSQHRACPYPPELVFESQQVRFTSGGQPGEEVSRLQRRRRRSPPRTCCLRPGREATAPIRARRVPARIRALVHRGMANQALEGPAFDQRTWQHRSDLPAGGCGPTGPERAGYARVSEVDGGPRPDFEPQSSVWLGHRGHAPAHAPPERPGLVRPRRPIPGSGAFKRARAVGSTNWRRSLRNPWWRFLKSAFPVAKRSRAAGSGHAGLLATAASGRKRTSIAGA